MFTWLRRRHIQRAIRREDRARRIVTDYLEHTTAGAKWAEETLYDGRSEQKSQGYYLAHASVGLDTTELKQLLRMDDQAVADWANALPETRSILHLNNLMFVYTHTFRRPRHTTDFPQHLTIVCLGSTHNYMSWPGK